MSGWHAEIFCSGVLPSAAYPTDTEIEAADATAELLEFGGSFGDASPSIYGADPTPVLEDENTFDINGEIESKHLYRFEWTLKVIPVAMPSTATKIQNFFYLEEGTGDKLLTRKYHFLNLRQNAGVNPIYPLQDKNVIDSTDVSGTRKYIPVAVVDYTPKHDYESGVKYMELKLKKRVREAT